MSYKEVYRGTKLECINSKQGADRLTVNRLNLRYLPIMHAISECDTTRFLHGI